MAKPRLYRGFVATNDSLSHAPPVNVLSITVFPGNRERLEERNKSNGGELEKGEGWNSSEREICLEGEESVALKTAELRLISRKSRLDPLQLADHCATEVTLIGVVQSSERKRMEGLKR